MSDQHEQEPPLPDYYSLWAWAQPLNGGFTDQVHTDVMTYEAREGALFFMTRDGRRHSVPLQAFLIEITPHYDTEENPDE